MQSLFCCTNQNKNERKKDSPSVDTSVQYIQIIDPRKAQNLSILLRALNVTTDEVIDALKEGDSLFLSPEGVTKMKDRTNYDCFIN